MPQAKKSFFGTNRRGFLNTLSMAAVGGATLIRTGDVRAATQDAQQAGDGAWPKMTYRTLGRTDFLASRLVYGAGASLSRKPNDKLLETALEAGVNVFDVGTSRYYGQAERHLGPFAKRHRDDIFLISKGMTYIDIDQDATATVEQAKQAAKTWTMLLDESLDQLGMDHVDAYYQMGASNPSLIQADEMKAAYDAAKAAGKADFFGVSTHQNAANVLTAMIETGWYSLAMLAITPAGWYDWNNRDIQAGTTEMKSIRPLLDKARASGIGLVGMKAGRLLAGQGFLGRGNPRAFDEFYDEKLLKANLSHFQRSYAYVLENGLDVVNADIQSYGILRENFVAAAKSSDVAATA